MPKYLQKRYRRWYAILEIPKELRPTLGKARFSKSLETDSQSIAEIRVLPIVAEWKKVIELARSGSSEFNDALYKIQQLELEPHHSADLAIDALFNEYEATGDVADKTFEAAEILAFGRVLLKDHVDSYMATQTRIQQKTQDMKQSDIKRFVQKFRYADEATNLALIDWIENSLISLEGLSPTTCRRLISSCRGFWVFLQRHRGLEIPLPFTGVVPPKRASGRAANLVRRHFTPNDYKRLLEGCPARDTQLSELIQLGAYTGARIEELCSLKVEDVSQIQFKIIDAKTAAGIRIVPIHSSISDLVETMKQSSNDGFLISGLSFNKYGDRSNAIGKRFGRLKGRLGYGSEFVFHSFRRGVATQFEQKGVPENEAARLLGHELKTMTFGLYSGGNIPFDRLKAIVEKLCWQA